MVQVVRVGQSVLGIAVAVLLFCASTATAARLTSPSYQLDSNLGGSFGGQTSSTSYKMASIGGEAVIGNGASGSYILDQRASASEVTTLQLGMQPGGLVGYYPLDENTGTTTDDASQYQNNGTFNGTAAWYGSGKIGSAVDMNGSTDSTGTGAVLVSDSPHLPSGSAMTVEAWVRQEAWYANQAIASHWQYNPYDEPLRSGSWAFQTGTDNNLRVFIADSQGDAGENYVDTAANTWETSNAWRHVAMVYDGSQSQANKVKVYIDGVLVGSTAYGTLPSSLQNSTGALSIGSFPGLGRAMTGAIDHVKLFNRALGAAEIKAEYNAQNAGASTGLGIEPVGGSSTTSALDAIVRTNAPDYTIAVQQDHDLQSGANTIPGVGGSIVSPVTWTENTTEGFGFTLTNAPVLDGKWGSGTKYAALPSSATSFYSGTGNANGSVDLINLQFRLRAPGSQATGSYSNTVIYTGTMIP